MSVKYHKEKGYGRQKIGDQKSSGFDSLAKGDGFGSRDLQGEPRLSKGRTIWINSPLNRLPCPSAILAGTDTAVRRIWLVNP
jgi:hypothetical protein